jgi:hypothetical protein
MTGIQGTYRECLKYAEAAYKVGNPDDPTIKQMLVDIKANSILADDRVEQMALTALRHVYWLNEIEYTI